MDARVQVYSDKMQKAFEFLEADFAAIRAGRANPHVLDKLRVDYYGTPTPIQQVGNVTGTYHPDRSLGEVSDQGDRKSDHDLRYRYQSFR